MYCILFYFVIASLDLAGPAPHLPLNKILIARRATGVVDKAIDIYRSTWERKNQDGEANQAAHIIVPLTDFSLLCAAKMQSVWVMRLSVAKPRMLVKRKSPEM